MVDQRPSCRYVASFHGSPDASTNHISELLPNRFAPRFPCFFVWVVPSFLKSCWFFAALQCREEGELANFLTWGRVIECLQFLLPRREEWRCWFGVILFFVCIRCGCVDWCKVGSRVGVFSLIGLFVGFEVVACGFVVVVIGWCGGILSCHLFWCLFVLRSLFEIPKNGTILNLIVFVSQIKS